MSALTGICLRVEGDEDVVQRVRVLRLELQRQPVRRNGAIGLSPPCLSPCAA
jgi:hypothetical protein